jgi:hypothetical protein
MREPLEQIHELLYRVLRDTNTQVTSFWVLPLCAWRYRDSLKEGAPLRPWLYRVATNACLESMSVVWFPASSETFQ